MATNPSREDEEFKQMVIEELKALREFVTDHEKTLYGHEDSRRRNNEPGVVHILSEIAKAFSEVKAVAKAGWGVVGLVGFATVVSLFSLFSTRMG